MRQVTQPPHALSPGSTIGPYEIVELRGEGAMGQVYKARDTRLDRTVAIKILPQQAAADDELAERFEREAKTLAALSHPHICPIFDVGEAVPSSGPVAIQGEESGLAGASRPVRYLVMEYLQGETLDARLARGALPIADALRYAAEIARALDAAHRQGITHRDVKPGNIMLTSTGARLLDFGLARLRPPVFEAGSASAPPTATGPLTAHGRILGTLQYMAPEQLEGNPADERSDIFALGTVLYEMVTGERAFRGDGPATVIGAILSSEPPAVSSMASLSPPALDHLVTTCLAKDPDLRWQSVADVQLQLQWILAAGGARTVSPSAGTSGVGLVRWQWVAAALAIALIGSWILPDLRPRGGPAGALPAVTRHVLNLSSDQHLSYQMSVFTPSLALSPDGRRLIHVGVASDGVTRLYMRNLDQFEGAPLPGTAGAYRPFFSPDGAWVGFFQDGKLRRVSTAGGEPVTICATSSQALGADWLSDETIIFAAGIGAGLMRVAASGGIPEVVTVPDAGRGEVTHASPQAFPNGQDILFGVQRPTGFQIAALSGATGRWRTLVDGVSARYLRTGHLVFSRGATLWAVPFDLDALAVEGEPQPVVEHVRPLSIAGGDYAVSNSGLLAYVYATRAHPLTEVRWVDRSGRRTMIGLEPATYAHPRLSPDGTRLAFSIYPPEGLGSSVWLSDWGTGRRERINVEGNIHIYPLWAPDGSRVTFTSARADGRIYWKRADGSSDAERIVATHNPAIAGMWSPDGRVLVYVEVNPDTREDLWAAPIGGEPTPLVQTRSRETAPAFSPDGRWLAYASDDSGRHEVYVVRYPELDRRSVVSNGGGREPLWSPRAGELFYLDAQNRMVAVPMAGGRPAGPAQVLFETSVIRDRFLTRTYDVASDGRRFVLSEPIEATPIDRVHIVENWFEELARLVPVK